VNGVNMNRTKENPLLFSIASAVIENDLPQVGCVTPPVKALPSNRLVDDTVPCQIASRKIPDA